MVADFADDEQPPHEEKPNLPNYVFDAFFLYGMIDDCVFQCIDWGEIKLLLSVRTNKKSAR